MGIEYQLSKKDYIKFSKLYMRDVLQKRRIVFILLIIFFIFALSGDTFVWWRFLLALIISPFFVLSLSYFIPFLISLIRINKAFSKGVIGSEEKKLNIIEKGLLIESEFKTTLRTWESIVSIQSNDKFLYLILADKKAVPIPKSAFESESEVVNFLGLIQSEIIKVRGISPIYCIPNT